MILAATIFLIAIILGLKMVREQWRYGDKMGACITAAVTVMAILFLVGVLQHRHF